MTAFNRQDAIAVLQQYLFDGGPLPAIKSVIDDVALSRLEQRHVAPNIGDMTVRGIWYPNRGYTFPHDDRRRG